jgi:hypothetical protein
MKRRRISKEKEKGGMGEAVIEGERKRGETAEKKIKDGKKAVK